MNLGRSNMEGKTQYTLINLKSYKNHHFQAFWERYKLFKYLHTHTYASLLLLSKVIITKSCLLVFLSTENCCIHTLFLPVRTHGSYKNSAKRSTGTTQCHNTEWQRSLQNFSMNISNGTWCQKGNKTLDLQSKCQPERNLITLTTKCLLQDYF